jgi:hypothetical protein
MGFSATTMPARRSRGLRGIDSYSVSGPDEVLPGARCRARFVVADIPVEHTDASLYALRNLVTNPLKWVGELRRQGVEVEPRTLTIDWRQGASKYVLEDGEKYRTDVFLVEFTFLGTNESYTTAGSGLGGLFVIALGIVALAAAVAAAAALVGYVAKKPILQTFEVVKQGVAQAGQAAGEAVKNLLDEAGPAVGRIALPAVLGAGALLWLWARGKKR